MEFKYILELIKNELYEEFFEDIKTAMPPFMNPEVYGRSILENSSFIAFGRHAFYVGSLANLGDFAS